MGWLSVYSEDGPLGERKGEGMGGMTEARGGLLLDVV